MSAYQTLHFRITGIAPLLMHNGRLADPLDPHAQALAAAARKRGKVDSDHLEIARLEFLGSLYLQGGEPCIPAEMVEAALIRAAAKKKKATVAKAAMLIRSNAPLLYQGPRDPHALWSAGAAFRHRTGVRVGMTRVMRTRPRFDDWSADISVDFLPTMIEARDLADFFDIAGEQVGIGDWRPRCGRFVVAAREAPASKRPTPRTRRRT
ncbi:hypothetical protein [Roseicella frigidaeris]|uniref:hypothetical protein n=1 Tax=Roseicella frigidaeris TaxID=2230885 RepID=UPI000FDE6ED8|nr:hypothetical protein [Roseicella frigidaeris]